MNIRIFVLGLLVLLSLANVGFAVIGENWTVVGNTVFANDSKAFISVSPHTLKDSGEIQLSMLSKQYTGNLDLIFGFNSTIAKPRSLQLYNPQYWNETVSYSCNPPFWYNYTLSPKYFWCWSNVTTSTKDNATNVTTNTTSFSLVYGHDFQKANLTTNTVYWDESHQKNYTDLTDRFTKQSYSYGGMDTWYIADNLPVVAGEQYGLVGNVEVPIRFGASSGKYWMCTKPSSQTLSQAKDAGALYCLDPWWNVSWPYRHTVSTVSSLANVSDYRLKVFLDNATLSPLFNWSKSGLDLRFTNSADNASLPLWLEEFNANKNITVWVQVPVTQSNGTIRLYYGNANALNTSSYTNFLIDSSTLNSSAVNYQAARGSGIKYRPGASWESWGSGSNSWTFIASLNGSAIDLFYDGGLSSGNCGYQNNCQCSQTTTSGKKSVECGFNSGNSCGSGCYGSLSFDSHAVIPDDAAFGVSLNIAVTSTPTYPLYFQNLNYTILPLDVPIITIQSPQNTTYASATLSLNYTVSSDLAVSQCKYELNGGANVSLANCANTTFTATEGSNSLKVWANDTTGNWGVSATLSFTVDTTPPVVAITTPVSDDLWYATAPSLAASCTDTNFVNLTINHTSYTATKTSTPATWMNISEVLQGVNAFRVTCTDLAGNTGTADRTFKLDTAVPSVSCASCPVSSSSSNIAVSVTVTDALSGVDTVRVYYRGSYYAMTASGSVYSYTLTENNNGEYTYQFFANDSAGNMNSILTGSVVVGASTSSPPPSGGGGGGGGGSSPNPEQLSQLNMVLDNLSKARNASGQNEFIYISRPAADIANLNLSAFTFDYKRLNEPFFTVPNTSGVESWHGVTISKFEALTVTSLTTGIAAFWLMGPGPLFIGTWLVASYAEAFYLANLPLVHDTLKTATVGG